ncbi:MAG: hypothetical protein A2V81_02890 [Candidatus Abawacabacteria bacterium RBG_16_42_10]|uniref:Uncharacterized protein n=1 Tax=Candidatus Abawacabacteria bacterium RBG_16_42_10 TaxID=1817814 RepID=A0A1F4XLU6_9BACT|nr:MAG: hypothetical protein A2V81_02890 [Candidatus Abawacabacteria bacterium RBG_16_42_10]
MFDPNAQSEHDDEIELNEAEVWLEELENIAGSPVDADPEYIELRTQLTAYVDGHQTDIENLKELVKRVQRYLKQQNLENE